MFYPFGWLQSSLICHVFGFNFFVLWNLPSATETGIILSHYLFINELPVDDEYYFLSQLARRVREMRETRTAPAPQKFDRKVSAIGRPGLNHLQSFPRGMECIDPLGLG